MVAFDLDPATGELTAHDDFLPLRRWAGRGLVRAGDGAWYDFGYVLGVMVAFSGPANQASAAGRRRRSKTER